MKSVGDLKAVPFKQACGMLVPVALLLVLPLFGAKAMMVGSAVGMMIVSVIYRESLPGQRAYSTVICLAAAMALGSVLAVAFGR